VLPFNSYFLPSRISWRADNPNLHKRIPHPNLLSEGGIHPDKRMFEISNSGQRDLYPFQYPQARPLLMC
jgi:hypothetical protein